MLTLLKAGSICGMENCSYSKIRDTKNKNGANLLAGWIQFKLIFSGLDSMTSVYILLIPQLAFWWSTHYWSHLKNKQTKNPECDCINSQDWFFLCWGGGSRHKQVWSYNPAKILRTAFKEISTFLWHTGLFCRCTVFLYHFLLGKHLITCPILRTYWTL